MRVERTIAMAALGWLMLGALAGCQNEQVVANRASADINSAAEHAQGDIDTYASNALQTPSEAASSAPLPPPEPTRPAAAGAYTPPAPGEPGGLPDGRTPMSEAPFTADSAQGAANVVQTYFALIEEGKYRQAWALWDDNGKASGMSAPAFAASFDKYAEYHANIGAPGRIDAGAGQRHVAVPVQVYGRLKDGHGPFNLRGDVILHRAANIDGATARQKMWRLSASTLKRMPGQPMGGSDDSAGGNGTPPAPPSESGRDDATPATASADYRCDDDFAFHVTFDNRAQTATMRVHGQQIAVLDAKRAGSGIWYAGEGYNLRGKGDQAELSRPGGKVSQCRAK